MVDVPIVNFNYSYSNMPNSKIEDRFQMNFKPVLRSLMPWTDELVSTAESIGNNAKKPLYLCLSGGIDSEVMALAFLKAGIKFKVLTVKNGDNIHDIKFAIAFCRKHKLEQKLVDVDLTTYHKKYLANYRSYSMFRYLQLFILETVEALGGTAVLGGGEQIYYTDNDVINIKYAPCFTLPLQWCENNNTVHYPYFHMQNPELLASYMKIDLIDFLLANPDYFVNHHSMSIEKILVYHRYFDMPRRSKFHGFENFRPLKKYLENELSEMHPDIEPMFIPVSKVKQQLGID